MSKPDPPTPPNPYATAAAQTGTNVATGVANAYLNNVNQVTPQGNLTYSAEPGANQQRNSITQTLLGIANPPPQTPMPQMPQPPPQMQMPQTPPPGAPPQGAPMGAGMPPQQGMPPQTGMPQPPMPQGSAQGMPQPMPQLPPQGM